MLWCVTMNTLARLTYKNKLKSALIAALISLPLLGYEFLAWSNVEKPSTALTTLPKVVFDVVKKSRDSKLLTYPVKVEPVIGSTLVSELDGTVKSIKKSLGAEVKKGQVILVIQNNDPAFTFAPVAVRAPYDGVITQFLISPLTKVNRGDKLVTVVQPKRLKMTAEVPAAELNYIKSNQEGIFNTDNYSDQDAAEIFVDAVSPVVDPKTNTAQVELLFLSKKNLPKIGTVGYAKFQIPLVENIKIPETSVTFFEGDSLVRLIDENGTVKKQAIEIESQSGTNIIVKKGLNGGEKLIVRTPRPLKDGEKVEAVAAPKAE